MHTAQLATLRIREIYRWESRRGWLRGVDLNHRPLGYEPNELPDCSTPQVDDSNHAERRQTQAEQTDGILLLATVSNGKHEHGRISPPHFG
jgi:hypothetical protein